MSVKGGSTVYRNSHTPNVLEVEEVVNHCKVICSCRRRIQHGGEPAVLFWLLWGNVWSHVLWVWSENRRRWALDWGSPTTVALPLLCLWGRSISSLLLARVPYVCAHITHTHTHTHLLTLGHQGLFMWTLGTWLILLLWFLSLPPSLPSPPSPARLLLKVAPSSLNWAGPSAEIVHDLLLPLQLSWSSPELNEWNQLVSESNNYSAACNFNVQLL